MIRESLLTGLFQQFPTQARSGRWSKSRLSKRRLGRFHCTRGDGIIDLRTVESLEDRTLLSANPFDTVVFDAATRTEWIDAAPTVRVD